ncbi:hypothetical protein V2A60_002334 [Cordyceps javanica]
MRVSEEPAYVPIPDNLDNLKLGDLKDDIRTYILKVYDTIQPLMLDGQHGLSFEGVSIALSYFGADDSDSELLMAQEVYHRWTKAEMLMDDVELSWLVEQANLRRLSLEEFETIATRWLRGKDENALFQRIGWICALTTEYIAAQVFLDEKHAPPAYIAKHDNNDYTLGRIGKHNVVIAVLPGGEYGTASAAGVARDMLHSFPNIRIGLMVGIGGGAPTSKHDIRLGDVVVSEPQNGLGGVFQYDFGKTIQDQPPTVLLAAISGLRAKHKIDGHSIQQDVQARLAGNKRLRKEFGRPGAETDRLYQSHIVHPPGEISCLSSCDSSALSVLERTARDEDEDDPAIHYGLVASANQLMKNAILRDQYANEKGILCFEMEAGGLMNHFPCLVIRGICDYSDTHKNKDWQGYAAMTAAAYAKDLLKRILPTKVEAEKKIIEMVENVNQTLNQLQVTSGETFTTMTEMQNSMNRREIKLDMDKLPYARGATFNSKDQDHTTCHPNTRVDLLRQIKDWIRSSNSKSIFWLHGSAGTGKSTISWTIAELLASGSIHKEVDLGASFFFRRGEGDRGSASLFFPTIVRQLVLKIPGLDSFIADAITSDPIIFDKALGEQFENLLYQPLRKIRSGLRDRLILVLVVDALDECDKADDIETILELWSRIPDISTVRLKLFLTSRPELPIRIRFRSIPATVYQKMSVDAYQDILLYDAVPQTTIQQDISTYLESAFSKFQSEFNNDPLLGTPLDHDWPGENILAILVNKAVPLFIVAATLYRFVSDDNYDPKEQLETILNFLEMGQLEQMEQTYLPVLNQLAAKFRKSHNRVKLYEECRMVIGSIVTLVEPLSRKSLAVLLQSPPDILKLRLDPLHSVLRIPDEIDMPIRTLHLSFAEFLLSNRSQHELKVDGPTAHQLLLTKSLQLLSRADGVKPEGLHENLCSLRYPGQLRREVEQSIINQRLSPAVQYACRYWVHHAQQSKVDLHDGCQVHIFLKKHFLHWLEAMSFLNRIADVIAYVNVLRSLVPPQGSNELRAVLDDARRFTLTHRYIADLAPLQLYSSVLAFTPQCSIIRRDYGKTPEWLPELPITSIAWGPEFQTLEGHTSSVNAVAFSQDGSLLASASFDNTVRLWNPSTGQELQKFGGINDCQDAP